jgi:MFS family permease
MTKFKLPENELILYALALAQTLGFTYACVSYESSANLFVFILVALRGVLLGAALSFGAAVAAQRAPRVQSKRAREIGYLALGGLLIVSPVIMAPAIMAALPEAVRAILAPWAQWSLSVSLAVAPDFVAVAVAAQSGTLQPHTATVEQTASEPKRKAAKVEPVEPAPEVVPVAPVFACATCQREFATQNSLNAHERAHKAKVVGYKVNFEEVKK